MNVCMFGKALNCQSPPGPQELEGSGGTRVALWLSGPGLLDELRFHQPPASCGQVWPPAPRASPRVGGPGPGGDERQEHGCAAPPHSRRALCRRGAHVQRGCPRLWRAQPTLLGPPGSAPPAPHEGQPRAAPRGGEAVPTAAHLCTLDPCSWSLERMRSRHTGQQGAFPVRAHPDAEGLWGGHGITGAWLGLKGSCIISIGPARPWMAETPMPSRGSLGAQGWASVSDTWSPEVLRGRRQERKAQTRAVQRDTAQGAGGRGAGGQAGGGHRHPPGP